MKEGIELASFGITWGQSVMRIHGFEGTLK